METALTGLIVIAILVLAILTIAHSYLSAQDALLESWQEMEARLGEQTRTDLSPIGAETKGGGAIVEVTLQNAGNTKLADFDRWDVIVEYDDAISDHIIEWLPYEELGGSRWTVKGIYLDASEGTAEAFEPGILNPGEEIVVQMWLTPTVGMTTTNLATIVTPNGVTASTVFTY